jgi:DNA-directed RNA polymerase specialized sigma24 family protein
MTDLTRFLDALQDGDKRAWEQFYESHLQPLRPRLAQRFSDLSPAEIDDVWAAVIERVYQRIALVQNPQALGGWLWVVAYHTGLNYVARRKRHLQRLAVIEETLPDEQAQDPWAYLTAGDDTVGGQLWDAIEALPPLHRSVLVLRVRDGIPAEVVHYCTRLTPNQQRGVLGSIRRRFRNANHNPLAAPMA